MTDKETDNIAKHLRGNTYEVLNYADEAADLIEALQAQAAELEHWKAEAEEKLIEYGKFVVEAKDWRDKCEAYDAALTALREKYLCNEGTENEFVCMINGSPKLVELFKAGQRINGGEL